MDVRLPVAVQGALQELVVVLLLDLHARRWGVEAVVAAVRDGTTVVWRCQKCRRGRVRVRQQTENKRCGDGGVLGVHFIFSGGVKKKKNFKSSTSPRVVTKREVGSHRHRASPVVFDRRVCRV
jgi:hypothetical protein